MIELTCDGCGATIRRYPSHARLRRHFCSQSCYEAHGRRQETVGYRRMVRIPADHPLATPGGLIGEQRMVLFDKIGYGPHLCRWCAIVINWHPTGRTRRGAILADHVDNDPMNNAPENLEPSCGRCNTWRDRDNMIGADEAYVEQRHSIKGTTRTRAVARSCETCGDGFLVAPSVLTRGRGRFCSRSCARRAPRG